MTEDEKNIMTLVESARKSNSLSWGYEEMKEYDPESEPGPCDVKITLSYHLPAEMYEGENGSFNQYFKLTLERTKPDEPVDAFAEISRVRFITRGYRYSVDDYSAPVLNYGQRKTREFVEWLEGLFDEYFVKWQNSRLKKHRERHKREMDERLNWKPYEGHSENLARIAGFCAGAAESASGEK